MQADQEKDGQTEIHEEENKPVAAAAAAKLTTQLSTLGAHFCPSGNNLTIQTICNNLDYVISNVFFT